MLGKTISEIITYSAFCELSEEIKKRLLDKLFFTLPQEKQKQIIEEIFKEIKEEKNAWNEICPLA